MKSTLSEGERESVFPVDPCPNRISRLSITEMFCELHHADESEPPGRNRGLPDFRIDTRKQFIIIDISQFVTHLHVDICLSEMLPLLPGRSLAESREYCFFGDSSTLSFLASSY